MPRQPRVGSVVAKMTCRSAMPPFEMKRLEPFSSQPPSTRGARVRSADDVRASFGFGEAHRTQDDRLRVREHRQVAPALVGRAALSMAVTHSLVALIAVAMPAQPHAISSVTIICVSMSVMPPPPNSSG